MSWVHAPAISRLICLGLGAGSFSVAVKLNRMGALGIEDVPPPFILGAALAGFGFLGIAVIGRYPWPGA